MVTANTKPLWHGKVTWWIDNRVMHVSVPFTWQLQEVAYRLRHPDLYWDTSRVGGPAVDLLPEVLAPVKGWTEIGGVLPEALEHVNPLACRTSYGCPRSCQYCGIGLGLLGPDHITPLPYAPLRPIICDENLLACSRDHILDVLVRARELSHVDFNQGLNARLMREEYAILIGDLKNAIVRLALDSDKDRDAWLHAVRMLHDNGTTYRRIRTYVLIGFDSDPLSDWKRCQFVTKNKVYACPMWFHELDQMSPNNIVTERQAALGWNDLERKRIMQWYYQHNGTKYGMRDDVKKLLNANKEEEPPMTVRIIEGDALEVLRQ